MNQKTIQIIQRICRQLAKKYSFGFYSPEDIEQEGFIIALEALPRFNPAISSLKTFLYVHISNKLKTFKRDNYLRKDFTCIHCSRKDPECEYCKRREWRHAIKRHLMEPIDIDNVNTDNEKNMCVKNDVLNSFEHREILSIINKNLPVSMRADYIRLLEKIPISRSKRLAIENKIIQILEENGYYRE